VVHPKALLTYHLYTDAMLQFSRCHHATPAYTMSPGCPKERLAKMGEPCECSTHPATAHALSHLLRQPLSLSDLNSSGSIDEHCLHQEPLKPPLLMLVLLLSSPWLSTNLQESFCRRCWQVLS
jgi:hypothetical protein